jgi:hypothetical protein
MDEPGDMTAGLDDSFASQVGDRVKKIVDDAERDALAIRQETDREVRALLERARAEARERREAAAREAQAVMADRVRRMLGLHARIGDRAGRLASAAEDPERVASGVQAFLDALAERADLIAREAGIAATLRPTEPSVDEPEPELADPLNETRLSALRMAVAGISRSQLEQQLGETLAPEDATAVLDDVFGSPRPPFPKWIAAKKRAG